MNKRDAINEILLALNELPLDTEDNVEDIQIATIVDKQLDITRKKILAKGWFFNTTTIELVPNQEEYIVIPDTFLSVDGSDANTSLTVRDHKLFDKDNLTYKFEEAQECVVIQDIDFDDIPFVVTDYIIQYASLQAYINIIGNTDDISVRTKMLDMARIAAIREDANNRDGNVLDSDHMTDLTDRSTI